MNIIKKIFNLIKLLSFFFLFHFISFSNFLESKSKIYWCYGSFLYDDNIKWLLVSICSSTIPAYIFFVLLLFTNLFKKFNEI